MSLQRKLEKGLDKHYESLPAIAPGITGFDLKASKPIALDRILLPWRFTREQRAAFNNETLVRAERPLRVAQAHDALNRIRAPLGIRSYMTRHARKSNRYKDNKDAQHAIRRAEAHVNLWRDVYNHSWKALKALRVEGEELKGPAM